MIGQLLPQKAQCGEDALAHRGGRQVAAFFRDAQGSQPEACGGDAGDAAAIVRAHVAAVAHETGLRAGLLPEEQVVGALDVIKEPIVGRRQWYFSGDRANAAKSEDLLQQSTARDHFHVPFQYRRWRESTARVMKRTLRPVPGPSREVRC